jgi:hypothetical protein
MTAGFRDDAGMTDSSPTPGQAPGQAPSQPAGPPTGDDRNIAVLTHILGFLTGWLAPLIIWLLKKDSSPYITDHSKEALNFQITMFIAWIVAGVLTFAVIGCVLMPILLVVDLVFCILAAMAASRGEFYRYPMTIRLIS